MILYVNGDRHAAGADAIVPYNWADDDIKYSWMEGLPHPENLKVSWGSLLAQTIKYEFVCHARPGSSNARIIRTTRDWMDRWIDYREQLLVMIQWSTWDRDEWVIDHHYHQINASGHDILPDHYQKKYKEFISSLDWKECQEKWHQNIWRLHQDLDRQKIKHVFFNGDTVFSDIDQKFDWRDSYIEPYTLSYSNWLKDQNIKPVREGHWHYGAEAHQLWSQFLLKFLIDKKIIISDDLIRQW